MKTCMLLRFKTYQTGNLVSEGVKFFSKDWVMRFTFLSLTGQSKSLDISLVLTDHMGFHFLVENFPLEAENMILSTVKEREEKGPKDLLLASC